MIESRIQEHHARNTLVGVRKARVTLQPPITPSVFEHVASLELEASVTK